MGIGQPAKTSGTLKLTVSQPSSKPDYDKVFEIRAEAGAFSEDITELKNGLEEAGYTVVDKSQDGELKVYREEGDE